MASLCAPEALGSWSRSDQITPYDNGQFQTTSSPTNPLTHSSPSPSIYTLYNLTKVKVSLQELSTEVAKVSQYLGPTRANCLFTLAAKRERFRRFLKHAQKSLIQFYLQNPTLYATSPASAKGESHTSRHHIRQNFGGLF
jgi:hypothetical protein